MSSKTSPFLYPGSISVPEKLAIIHLKRDLQVSTILKEHDEDDEGYAEGKVVNTRFGSFPHSTLIGLPWGSQVRASKVDTGSRGRRVKGQDKKRKREEESSAPANKTPKLDADDLEGERQDQYSRNRSNATGEQAGIEIGQEGEDIGTPATPKDGAEAVAASSGFIHLLPPTPENWTSSLPHRTQVVYTPDYSYILHRLRVRPGTSLIEAGAGSGSFTHASARAVFNGYPNVDEGEKLGKVWSFEFHEFRHEKLQKELVEHGLDEIVRVSHRDVCEDGFLVDGNSPNAEAIFLDLPAPWVALKNLTRSKRSSPSPTNGSTLSNTAETTNGNSISAKSSVSPLNPSAPVYICTFSPCIEQVQRTVSAMRNLGWIDISMVEVSQKRLEVRRERIGIDNGVQRGLQTTPATVDEALQRLVEVEGTFKAFHETGEKAETRRKDRANPNNREKIIESLVERKVFKEGKLVHRTVPDVKTHTSYLVFAVLPQEWSEEDEARAKVQWHVKIRRDGDSKEIADGEVVGLSKRQMKKAARQAMKDQAATDTATSTPKELNSTEEPQVIEEDSITK